MKYITGKHIVLGWLAVALVLLTGCQSDGADMCFIELVDFDENMMKTEKKARRTRRSRKSAAAEAPAAEAVATEAPEAPAEEAPAAE